MTLKDPLFVTHGFPLYPGGDFMSDEVRRYSDIGIQPRYLIVRNWRITLVSADLSSTVALDTANRRLPRPVTVRRLLGDRGRRYGRARLHALSMRLRSASIDWTSVADLNGVGHVHAFWASSAAGVAEELADQLGVSWSFAGHRADVVADIGLKQKLRASAFVRSTNPVSDSYLSSVRGGSLERIRIGVDIPPIIARQTDGKVTLVVPASLKPVKGHSVLFESLAHLRKKPEFPIERVSLCGSGVEERRLREQARVLGLHDIISFEGYIDRDDLVDRYRHPNVVVCLPSVDLGRGLHEGLPIALVEAMAAGAAVVCTAAGGVPELAADGRACMVEAGDATALAAALETVCSDRDLRFAMAVRARSYVESNHCSLRSTKHLTRLMGITTVYPPTGGSKSC